MNTLRRWFSRLTDSVAVALLTAMFCVFILQIFCRYIINYPLGWTLEACLLSWLWLVFWGCAFNVDDHEHVRFDIVQSVVPPLAKKIFAVISAVAIITGLAISLQPTFDFVSFMKIESTSLLHIRFDVVFSIYLVFSVAVIARYTLRIFTTLRNP